MKLALAAIALCLVLVIAFAAAAGIFERSGIPLIIIAFLLVIGLGAAPVVFSAISRRGKHRNPSDPSVETVIVRPPTLPPTAPTNPPMLAHSPNPALAAPVMAPVAHPPAARRTLAAPAVVRGTTLFTAASTTITIRPAEAGRGIVFRRIDLPKTPEIPAVISNLLPDSRHTVLRGGADRHADVHTTEHILSALVGLGITDALLDLDGPEVPIGDGSAAPFVEAILAAGLAERPAPSPRAIVVGEPVVVRDAAASIECLPSAEPGTTYEYRLDYGPHAGSIPAQSASIHLNRLPSDEYRQQVAPARTFCLAHEAQAMRQMGLFTHLSAREMLVIGSDGKPIDNAFRFPDEPARHKLLDLIGDLALVGHPIRARIIASRSGHALNQQLARRLAALPTD